jgi:hypothetical protein
MAMEDQLSQVVCPGCGEVGSLGVELRLVAKPIGSFSLAGAQMKVSAREGPHLVCTTVGCGFTKAASTE